MNAIKYIFSHIPSRAVALLFLCNGFFFGSWAVRIPDVKIAFEFSDQELGFALLILAIGSLCIMPFMGKLSRIMGAGKASFFLSFAFGFVLPLPLLMSNSVGLAVVLFALGMAMGGMDIAMNTAAAIIEAKEDVRIMSAFHGFWSSGMMLGSGIGSLLKGAGVEFALHMLIVVTPFFLFLFLYRQTYVRLKEAAHEAEEPAFALPGKGLIILAIVALISLMAEGAIADWSTLYMLEGLNTPDTFAGWSLSAFALCMAIGRFWGDELTDKFGAKNILIGGNVIVAISLGALLLLSNTWIAVLGFGVAGIGFSAIFPVIFSEAAKTPGMSTGGNMAAIGSVGYFGMLVGPPLIGFIAEALSLPEALGLIAVACVFSALIVKLGR